MRPQVVSGIPAVTDSKMFSNKVVALIACVLFTAIMLDGKAYNRTPERVGIYSLPDRPTVTLKKDNGPEPKLSFSHLRGRWFLTEPFIAPAISARIEALMSANTVTSRSYRAEELDIDALFKDAVIMEIGAKSFKFGQLEPVSQQRYVLAGQRVYLQSDNVVPLLQAGANAFIDLSLTDSVKAVAINNKKLEIIDAWSNLNSPGLIPSAKISNPPVAHINVTTSDNLKIQLELYSVDNFAVLHSSGEHYGYLLSAAQAEALQLTDYL